MALLEELVKRLGLTLWFPRRGTTVPADFVANDFEAIARAMKRNAAPSTVVLHFWDMLVRLTNTHESVEAAVEEAFTLVSRHTVVLNGITTIDGVALLDKKALAEAMIRFGEGMPV